MTLVCIADPQGFVDTESLIWALICWGNIIITDGNDGKNDKNKS